MQGLQHVGPDFSVPEIVSDLSRSITLLPGHGDFSPGTPRKESVQPASRAVFLKTRGQR